MKTEHIKIIEELVKLVKKKKKKNCWSLKSSIMKLKC